MCLAVDISQLVNPLLSRNMGTEQKLKFYGNLLKAFWVTLKACFGLNMLTKRKSATGVWFLFLAGKQKHNLHDPYYYKYKKKLGILN